MGVGGRLRERERLVLAEEVDFGGGEAELRVGDGGGELRGHVMRLGGAWGAWWMGFGEEGRRTGVGERGRGRGGREGVCRLGGCVGGGLACGWMRVLEKSAR